MKNKKTGPLPAPPFTLEELITPQQQMKQLHSDLIYWQRELRLDGVEIELRWLEFEDVKDEKVVGKFFSFSPSHRFEIGIAPDLMRELNGIGIFNTDNEVILIHELLHIVDCRWMENNESEEVFRNEAIKYHHEIALDSVAEALVRARRGMKR
jgi:hypothetical protein